MSTLVSTVKPSDIVIWLARVKINQRASPFNRWRLLACQLFDMDETDGLVSRFPFVDRVLHRAKKERVVRLIPTEDEFRGIVATIRNPFQVPQCGRCGEQRAAWQHQSADFVEFLGLPGVGQAEAAALRWSDIDETRNEILYTRQKTREPFKTPIYGWLKPLILRLKASRKEGGDAKGSRSARSNMRSRPPAAPSGIRISRIGKWVFDLHRPSFNEPSFIARTKLRLGCHMPRGITRFSRHLRPLLCTRVTRIGEHRLLFSMQQMGSLVEVGFSGRGGPHRAHQRRRIRHCAFRAASSFFCGVASPQTSSLKLSIRPAPFPRATSERVD